MSRPATIRSARPASETNTQLRRFTSVPREGDVLGGEPAGDLGANLVEALLCPRLEQRDDDRLRVGCADESPPVTEEHACAVHLDHVVQRFEMRNGGGDDRQLPPGGA